MIEGMVNNVIYYNYFINIASGFIPFEANVLPTWELACLFLLKIG